MELLYARKLSMYNFKALKKACKNYLLTSLIWQFNEPAVEANEDALSCEHMPTPETSDSNLTYEEENAVRYVRMLLAMYCISSST